MPKLAVRPAPEGVNGRIRSGADDAQVVQLIKNGEFQRAERVTAALPLDSSVRVMAVQGWLDIAHCLPVLAEARLRRALESEADSATRRLAYYGLQSIFTTAERYPALESLEVRALAEGLSTDTTNVTTAQALKQIGTSRIEARSPATELRMGMSPNGCPKLRVQVNGRADEFWLDTGASLSVIAEDLVPRYGIRMLDLPAGYAGTATERKVRFRFGRIDSLRLGDMVVRSLPVMVMKRSDINLGIPFLKVNGIVGWSVISRFRTTLDYPGRKIRLEYPAPTATGVAANLFFLGGLPIVQVALDSSGPLHFIFDTGAQVCMIQPAGLGKLSTGYELASATGCIGGAGGGGFKRMEIVRGATLTLDRQAVYPVALPLHDLAVGDFPIAIDGVVGESVLHQFTVVVDAPNGVVSLQRP
jgi:predicted aspartyl protease